MLTHGPMLMHLQATTVSVWLRTAQACTVTVTAEAWPGAPPVGPATGETRAEEDYTCTLRLAGMVPGAEYQGLVMTDTGDEVALCWRTLPARDSGEEVRLGIISDTFRHYPAPALAHLRGLWPHGVMVIGDHDHTNYLANTVTAERALAKARAAHRGLRGEESELGQDWQDYLVAPGLPVLAHVADDHDCGRDNATSLGRWWPQVIQGMQEYWPAPLDNGRHLGYLYEAVEAGGTLVVLLDTRTHRQGPGACRQLLGEEQWGWLQDRVQAVQAVVYSRLLVVSPVPVNPMVHKLDAWYGYPAEAERLHALLAPLEGRVMVMSADCHWGSIVGPPRTRLPEVNGPKLQANGFANTCNHQAAQWSVTSERAGGGFTLLTLREDEVLATMYNEDGTVRLEALVLPEVVGWA